MKQFLIGFYLVILGWLYFGGTRIEAESAPEKLAVCTACHGTTGTSANEAFPNLAGQKYSYLKAQLEAYKSGLRKDPTSAMNAVAATLSDRDVEELARYFSAQSK